MEPAPDLIEQLPKIVLRRAIATALGMVLCCPITWLLLGSHHSLSLTSLVAVNILGVFLLLVLIFFGVRAPNFLQAIERYVGRGKGIVFIVYGVDYVCANCCYGAVVVIVWFAGLQVAAYFVVQWFTSVALTAVARRFSALTRFWFLLVMLEAGALAFFTGLSVFDNCCGVLPEWRAVWQALGFASVVVFFTWFCVQQTRGELGEGGKCFRRNSP